MSLWNFEHRERPTRVLMGDDTPAQLPSLLDELGCDTALVVTTPGRRDLADAALHALGDRAAGLFDQSQEQVPRPTVEAAQQALADSGADCVVAVGGGSPIGVGKALALEHGERLPLIAMPTTYAGSEATEIWGISKDGRKTTGRDERVAPLAVVYVPSWTTSLPRNISAMSGVNALAHCVEALYAEDATPVTDMMSLESIRALSASLPRIMDDPDDLEARSQALWGAYLAGRALDLASLGLHHKLCHVLGGSFGTPHAATHSVVLPYATAYNAPAAPDAMAKIAAALGSEGAVDGLWELNLSLEVPPSLADLGFGEEDVDQAVEEALERRYPNPRPLEAEPLRAMLLDAVNGRKPGGY